jgi:hypothetical protein
MPPRSKRADAVRIRGTGRRLRGSRAFAQTPKNKPKTSDSVKELMAMVNGNGLRPDTAQSRGTDREKALPDQLQSKLNLSRGC